jgi:predicted 3-demethylubiquinone-9 3-methyltransferase (glyoxalase superfamily)
MTRKIRPFLWFKSGAEDATNFYVSLFKDAEILSIDRLNGDGPVFTTTFRIADEVFVTMQGGPEGGDQSKFNDSISFAIDCEDQAEVDHFWNAFADGGKPIGCGWIKDRFGVTWQVVPNMMNGVLTGPDRAGAARAMAVMSKMVKLDIAALQAAYDGK